MASRLAAVVFPVLILGLVAAIVWIRIQPRGVPVSTARHMSTTGCRSARHDFQAHLTGKWITVNAEVNHLLPDETGQYRHQRFIVRCATGQTLLIVNNVSIGSRVPITLGHAITVHGQYIWNARGGLIHFTHHDPEGGTGGWIVYSGKVYALASIPQVE